VIDKDIYDGKIYDILVPCLTRSCRGRDRMVVGFTNTCAISAYHH